MAKTKTIWYNLKDTDPEKYAEIKARADANRKAAHEKIFSDPVRKEKWLNALREGHKKRMAKKKQEKVEIEEEWKEVDDWVKEIEKSLLPRKNALRKLTKFLIAWIRKWRVQKQQYRFKTANPNYHKEWHTKHGGNAAILKKRKYKKDNKAAAKKHLEITEMTDDERRLFKYNNMLDNHTERCNTRNWLKRRNLPLERKPFLEFKDEPESKPEPKKVPLAEFRKPSAAYLFWQATLTKPERQMTKEEMQRAAGGP
jgi:hypothetical protein